MESPLFMHFIKPHAPSCRLAFPFSLKHLNISKALKIQRHHARLEHTLPSRKNQETAILNNSGRGRDADLRRFNVEERNWKTRVVEQLPRECNVCKRDRAVRCEI